MFGHALKWHDERDECGLARMAEGAARVGGAGPSAVDGAVWVDWLFRGSVHNIQQQKK
jgi:hypothetical protein